MGNVSLVSSTLLAAGAALTVLHRPRVSALLLRLAVLGLWLAVFVAIALLVRGDTNYEIAADYSRPGLSWPRRAMGLWGGSAGSLLLFSTILATVMAFTPSLKLQRLAPPIFITALAATSAWLNSPFEQLDNPAIEGSGLTPILEHWAMLIHPPLLYLGIALSLIPGLAHPIPVPNWTRAAIATLTLALALGAGWAYAELGWGGFYAWDPIENTALIPWLLLVASLHLPHRHRLTQWTLLTIWPVVFLGAAMTRTSGRTSVHAFADNASLAWVLWPLAGVALLFELYIGRRFPTTATANRRFLVPTGLLLVIAAIISLGTFWPLISGGLIGGEYYTRFLYPVVVVAVVAMGLVPRWNQPRQRLLVETIVGAVVGGAGTGLAGWTFWWQLLLGASLGAGILLTVLGPRVPLQRIIAHIGVLLILVGTLGATASVSRTVGLNLDQSTRVGELTITNLGVSVVGDDPLLLRAEISVDGEVLRPELAVFPERNLRLPEVAIQTRPLRDVQIILHSGDDDGWVLITVNREPLTLLVWLGSALLVIGFYWPRPWRRAHRRGKSEPHTGDRRAVLPDRAG